MSCITKSTGIDAVEIDEDELMVLIYIAGYIVHVSTPKMKCHACIKVLTYEKTLQYEVRNRRNLTIFTLFK